MRATFAILGVLMTGLLAPAAVRAVTLAPLNACYRSVDEASRETVHVSAGGFTPGEDIEVSIDCGWRAAGR